MEERSGTILYHPFPYIQKHYNARNRNAWPYITLLQILKSIPQMINFLFIISLKLIFNDTEKLVCPKMRLTRQIP